MQTYDIRLNGAQVSDDGTATRLIARTSSGDDLSLLFPSSELDTLISALNQAAVHSAQIKYKDKTIKRALATDKFEIIPHPSTDGILISFRIQGNY